MQDWSREELEREAARRGIPNVGTMTRTALLDALGDEQGEQKTPLGAAKKLLSRVVDRVRGAIPRPRKSSAPDPREVLPPTGKGSVRPSSAIDDSDSVTVTVAGEGRVLVRWDVAPKSVDRARGVIARGALCARAVIVTANQDHVVRTRIVDHELIDVRGEWQIDALPADARVTIAIGLKLGESFVSVAHSPVLRLGPNERASHV